MSPRAEAKWIAPFISRANTLVHWSLILTIGRLVIIPNSQTPCLFSLFLPQDAAILVRISILAPRLLIWTLPLLHTQALSKYSTLPSVLCLIQARAMAPPDRAPSVSSSTAEGYDEKKNSSDGSFVQLKAGEGSEAGDDVERAELLPEDHEQEKQAAPVTEDNSTRTAIVWMVVNTLATIGIVRQSTSAYSRSLLTHLSFRFSRTKLSFPTLP
jgi:hypothetical protein